MTTLYTYLAIILLMAAGGSAYSAYYVMKTNKGIYGFVGSLPLLGLAIIFAFSAIGAAGKVYGLRADHKKARAIVDQMREHIKNDNSAAAKAVLEKYLTYIDTLPGKLRTEAHDYLRGIAKITYFASRDGFSSLADRREFLPARTVR